LASRVAVEDRSWMVSVVISVLLERKGEAWWLVEHRVGVALGCHIAASVPARARNIEKT